MNADMFKYKKHSAVLSFYKKLFVVISVNQRVNKNIPHVRSTLQRSSRLCNAEEKNTWSNIQIRDNSETNGVGIIQHNEKINYFNIQLFSQRIYSLPQNGEACEIFAGIWLGAWCYLFFLLTK